MRIVPTLCGYYTRMAPRSARVRRRRSENVIRTHTRISYTEKSVFFFFSINNSNNIEKTIDARAEGGGCLRNNIAANSGIKILSWTTIEKIIFIALAHASQYAGRQNNIINARYTTV